MNVPRRLFYMGDPSRINGRYHAVPVGESIAVCGQGTTHVYGNTLTYWGSGGDEVTCEKCLRKLKREEK